MNRLPRSTGSFRRGASTNIADTEKAKPPIHASLLLLVAGTVGLAGAAIGCEWSGATAEAFWFWFGACLVGELLWVRLPFGQVTVSMASCFHFATLILLPREQAMLVCLLTGPVMELIVLRKPLIRAMFNGGQAALSVGAASWTLAAVAAWRPSGDTLAGFGLLALIAAAITYFVVNSGLVSLAVALHERARFVQVWRINFGTDHELLSNGALFSLGALLASAAAAHGYSGAVLVILPLTVAFQAYRWHVQARSVCDSGTAETNAPGAAA